MNKYLTILFILQLLNLQIQAQENDILLIKEALATQEQAWNKGDLDAFMGGYWKSDSLKFIGSRGVSYGWQTTLDNYKKSYPDKETMGILTFDILSIEPVSDLHYFVIGKWYLKRNKGDLTGYFSLLWRKIEGKWFIIADHSS